MDTVEAIASSEFLFDIEQVQLQFQIPSTIKKLLVSNNILYLILATGLIFRIDLENPETVTKIQLDLRGAKFKQAFLDYHGHHLIIQSTKSEFYYLNYKLNNYKHLSKLKGLSVSSISFFDECIGLNDTGPILISITTGMIYEYRIESNKETLFKQVWKSKDGIKYVGNTLKYQSHGVNLYQVLIALSNNRLMQFNCQIPSKPVGSVSVFQNSFKMNALQSNFNNIELITGNNKLFGFLNPDNEDNQYSLTFGNIDFKNKNELHYLKLDLKPDITVTKFLLTKYYILVLESDNQLTIYNQLNLQKVSSKSLDDLDNNFEDFYFDVMEETYWMFSSKAIFEVVIDNENLGIWKLMVEKNMFDEALAILKHPKTTDKLKCDTILIKKGNYLIEKGDYITAAKILANTSESFDKITLKFMELEDKNILRTYLIEKLKTLSNSVHSQKFLISSWIVESYIEALNELDNKLLFSNNGKNNLINLDSNKTNVEIDNIIADEKKNILNDFYQFLDDFKDCLDKETVYQIILSHNRKSELLYFANLIQDFQFVLKYYINLQMWKESLNVLVVKQQPDLIYKCATVLLVNYPIKTVDTWIRLVDDLDYMKLVPALLTYNKNIAITRNILPEYNQALRFLKFLINEKKVKNKIIHNTFFSILITYPNLENENLILKYLENQQNRNTSFGKSDNYEILFDSDFIVRLCFRFKKIQSVIYIYSILGKYDEAVNLALDNDLIDVAILVADKPLESSSLERKKLWLKISEKLIQKVIANDKFLAQHDKLFELTMISNENGTGLDDTKNKQISNLLTFLTSKCEFLTIRDLLPLFPDFIVIDNFKDDIVDSLKKLSLEMSHLSNEMSSSIEESEKINFKIANFKKDSFQIVEPHESCLLCNKILSVRKFIVFPCFHSFHQDCLVKEIMESNDYKFKNAIYKLQKKIIMNSKNKEVMEELKGEIDDLLSTACCLCTDIKINDIEEPLIKPGDKEQISWEL